ncbi:pyridoxal phosphate-dependent transferase [Artemisia annua]|uniref:Pyridoxal phosphate-dependent transferase n=1 Tax=Artemisia annua TaxID=35608 RepID=A0A2U1KY20_ARTAN|nr:pyridoxal phosphate-dependent transferase [Artemisia annua]
MKIYHEAAKFVKKCLRRTEDGALLFCRSGTTTSIKRLHEILGIGQEGGKIVKNRTADIIQETRKLNLKKKGGIPETQSTFSSIGSCKQFQQMRTQTQPQT